MKIFLKKLASFLMAGVMFLAPIPTHAYTCDHSDCAEFYLDTEYAFADNNPEHMKSDMYEIICNDCGKRQTSINATLELHTFNSSGKCICGYEKVAKCNHGTTAKIYSSAEYLTYTTLEHLKYYYYNIICVNCGEVVDSTNDYCWQSHTFNSDGKCECGYEKTVKCKHSTTENVCALVEYCTHTTLEHLEYYLYDVTCVSCGEVVTNIHDFEWQSHTFNSNGKCACGYVQKLECSHDSLEKVCVSEDICYGKYTKEKHAVKSEYEFICKNCGKKTAEDSKENWILHEFDSNGRCDCGYSNPLKCKHDNVVKEYDRYEYEEYNTKKHYVDEYYNHICENCGKIVDTSCESSLEKHKLDSRGSCYCGYEEEIECKHKDTTKTEYKEPKVFPYNAEKHTVKYYYEIICKDCGEVVDKITDTEYYLHRYDSYGECECGHEKKTLSTIVLKNGNKTVYVDGNKTTWEYAPKNINGTTMVPLTIAVEALGGEYVSWDTNLYQAVVRLNGNELKYQKNTKKYWVDSISKTSNEKAQIVNGKLYVELKTLLNITNQVANYKDGYIIISEDWLTQSEMQQVIDEMFGKSESSDDKDPPSSGNQQGDSIDLTDIKAGKVYATSSDGKHIHKRTYNPSKELKYDDVYVYTLANFTLPKDAALTINGNYLYLDGEKVSASPSILEQADKRITHLNKIIDGANNAYSANTIDKDRRNKIRSEAESVIQEYKKVMEGKTSLSKVSEMKKSYKAKVGQNNSTVKQIQEKLYELGYTSQLTTGYYGDITFNNVAYFQIVNGLTVTGWVDNETYKLINQSYEELTEVPAATIEEVINDREGGVSIHATGNEATQKLEIVIQGNNFSDSIIVEDCEAWLVSEIPSTGNYTITVTAYSKNGKSHTEGPKTYTLNKYSIIQQVFEDLSEEQQIGYEIQLGVLKSLAKNLILEPAVSLTNALDYVYNYPNTYAPNKRAQSRAEYVAQIEANIASALPYGTEYYYAGEMLGEATSIAIDAILIVNGVEALVTGIKQLPNGVKIVTAQIANATTGSYETLQLVVDGSAMQASVAQIAKGTITLAVAVKSGVPSSEWKDVSEANDNVNEKASSKKLADNMEAAGRYRPRDYKTAAHHIVAGTSKKAQEARDILKRFGIGINNEANGVFLTTQKGVSNSIYHPSMHTYEYYEKVNRSLRYATSREDVIAILQDIAEQLSAGTF